MADNELKEQLDNIVAGKGAADNTFFQTLAFGRNAFEGFSEKDLKDVLALIPDNSPYKGIIVDKINAKLETISSTQTASQDQTLDNTPTPAAQSTPIDSPINDEDVPLDFLKEPSYSQYKAFEIMVDAFIKANENDPNKANENDPNKHHISEEDVLKIKDYINNAKKIIDMAAKDDEITPEKAVLLKDYFEILNLTEENKEYNKELEAKVDEQLAVFDKENDLEQLNHVSAEDLYHYENGWLEIAEQYFDNGQTHDDTDELIKQLCIQELKVSATNDIIKHTLEIYASENNTTYEDAENIYSYLCNKPEEELSPEDKRTLEYLDDISDKLGTEIFKETFEELKEQFQHTVLTELAKREAEEIYPTTPEMSAEEQAEILKKRAEYIADNTPDNSEKWAEKNALRVLKRILKERHPEEELSEEDLMKRYGKEFADIKAEYDDIVKQATEATQVAYALRVETLACRTARLTQSPNVHPETGKFLEDFAKKHPTMYGYGKVALVAGKKALLTQVISHAAGLNGLAVYSAYNTFKSCKKAYNEYLEKGGEKGFKNFVAYLRKPENRDKRIDLLKQVAISGIAISAAVAGNITGLGIGGAAMAPVIKRVGTGIASIGAETAKVVGGIKEWNEARKSGDKDAQKAAGKKLKKNWLGLGIAAASLVGAGFLFKHFAGNGDENKLSDLDEKLVKEGNGEGLSDDESKQILKNMDDLRSKSNGDVTDPMNMKGGENSATDTPTADGQTTDGQTAENGEEAVAEVPALTEADVKLLVTDCKMGPDPIVSKLEQMGVLSAEDKAQLIASGGRRDGVASRVLAAYLGHSYDGTEVPVHANLTPEQQQELNQFLRGDEYQQQCDKCNAAAIANRLAKVRQMNAEHQGGGKGNGEDGTSVDPKVQDGATQQIEPTKYEFTVAQRKQAFFNLIHKSVNPQDMSATIDEKQLKGEYAALLAKQGCSADEIKRQVDQFDVEKYVRGQMASAYFKEHDVKRVEIVGSDGTKHIYYHDKTNNGETTQKFKDIDSDNHKTTTIIKQSSNGVKYVEYKGKMVPYSFIDKDGNEVQIGTADKDKILGIVENPKTGIRTTMVKGDDGKKYTITTDIKTGRSTVQEGIPESAKHMYKNARER